MADSRVIPFMAVSLVAGYLASTDRLQLIDITTSMSWSIEEKTPGRHFFCLPLFYSLFFLVLLLVGIQTSTNAKFYALSASFDKFSNEGKTLVIQFTVKHEQKIDCGGGYVKVIGNCIGD